MKARGKQHSEMVQTAAMEEAEFDRFADEYEATHSENIKASGESPELFAAYKVADVRREIEGSTGAMGHPTVLDLGAGVGNSIPHFRRQFPRSRLICLDVSRRSLAVAEGRFLDQAEYIHFDGTTFPLDTETVDVGFAACVLHHVNPVAHESILAEFRRVIKPGGWLFLFEHNPFNPLTVRAVNTCPFDENAILIRGAKLSRLTRKSGFSGVKLRYRIFFPRFLAGLRVLEPYLTWCPLGAQYYVMARRGGSE